MSGLLTRDEAAELVGVRPNTISMWVTRGHLAPSAYTDEQGKPLYVSDAVYAAERRTRLRQPSRAVRRLPSAS